MNRFTQGNWHVVDDNGYLYVSAEDKDVCSVWSENEYDAQLIAEAPEMYELIQDTWEHDWKTFVHSINRERRERFQRMKALLNRIGDISQQDKDEHS